MRPTTTWVLAGVVIVCGALGAWAAGNSSLSWQASDRVVGVAGILAFILAAIALGRRSWARLPLLAACVFADMLTWTVYFDWSDGMAGFAYLGLSYLMILAAGLALVSQSWSTNWTANRPHRDQPPNRAVGCGVSGQAQPNPRILADFRHRALVKS